MSEVRIEKTYTLVIPKTLSQEKIVRKLRDVIANVDFENGLSDTYVLKVFDMDDNIDNYLKISVKTRGIYKFTTISVVLDGKKIENDYLEEENEPIIKLLLETFRGVLIIDEYEILDYCKQTGTYYGINYDVDSLDYKLIKMYTKQTDNPLEGIYLYKMTIDNAGELSELLK